MWYWRSADTTEKLKECSQYGVGSHVIMKHLKRSQNIDAQDGSIICNRRKMYLQYENSSNSTVPTTEEAAKLTSGLLSRPLILLSLGPQLLRRRELILRMVLLHWSWWR